MKIIFILYNIFEVKSGVSNKYIKFIDFLIKKNIDYLIISCLNDSNINLNYNIISLKGFNIPLYNNIKIPNIKYEDLLNLTNNNDIIIFNGEFYWIYDILNKIKKKLNNIKLIPNWHTNYDFYSSTYFNNNILSNKIKNILHQNLKNNFFSGIIVTGEINKNNFQNYSNYVFNANEICLKNFDIFKIDNYSLNHTINFIYTGRIALEKNLLLILDILNNLSESKFKNFKMHFIGSGPFLETLKENISNKIKKKIIFYGDVDYSQIIYIYKNLDNRIFIQPSMSETFGKSTMEASYSGIPIFIIKCDIHNCLYNEDNSFFYENIKEFRHQLTLFFKLNEKQKNKIILNGFNNAKKYDQNLIFENLFKFLSEIKEQNNKYYNESFINNIFNGIKCSMDYFEN